MSHILRNHAFGLGLSEAATYKMYLLTIIENIGRESI